MDTIETIFGWAVIIGIVLGASTVADYAIWPEHSVEKIIEPCRKEADSTFAVEIAKWRIDNQTDIFNPYRRERDRMIQECVERENTWCAVQTAVDWPCSEKWCFIPKAGFFRELYSLRLPDKKGLRCSGEQ